MQDLTLVILAAGMGSRFGGLKQIEPVGPNGEFIIDYSVHDAIKAGFNKVVFVIKEENYDIFKNTIGKRIEDKIKVEYVFQKLEDIPDIIKLPKDRVKPLGTAHALYSVRNNVNESFATINADDFYGQKAFLELGEALRNSEDYIMMGYEAAKTISSNGGVKRGVCTLDDGYVKTITESLVERINGEITCKPLLGGEEFVVSDNTPVCMLILGLRPSIFEYLKDDINTFLISNKNSLIDCEYYLPEVLNDMLDKKIIKMKNIATDSTWMGITYRSDLEALKEFIKKQIKEGVYPQNLY